jgi:hypothetical protein
LSQHDLNIANQGFPAFRADLNDALVALGSTNSGATAPATTYANQLWYDTANNILKIRNEDNDAWISIVTLDQSGDVVSAITAVTVNATTLNTGALNATGVTTVQAGTAAAPAITTTGDTNTGIFFPAADTIAFSEGGVESMRINASGQVGIGTSSPTQQLEVAATSSTTATILAQNTTATSGGAQLRAGNPQNLLIMGTDSNAGGLTGTANSSFFYTTSTSPIVFMPNATERMRIDSSGRVTKPFQPCFHVRVNNDAYISTSPIPFSNAPINVGSHFNTSTYKFTAPIAGKYYFILMLYVRLTGSQDITAYVRVNSTNRQYLNYIDSSSYDTITMPSIFDLSAGDTVDYTFQGTGTYYGGNTETNLFGYLLG